MTGHRVRRGFADGGAPFGVLSPGEEAEVPPTFLDRGVAGAIKGVANAAMVPGRVLASREPLSTSDMVGPAADMAGLVTLGAGAVPAEAGALRAGLGAGARLGDKPTAEKVAESIWQGNSGKKKATLAEMDRMRTFGPDRYGYTPEELQAIETALKDKMSRPFVSQAKMDRMAEEAEDAAENAIHKAEGGTVSDPAMKVARDVAAEGGDDVHIGAIRSAVAGRTDHHPMEVPSGCFVLPADLVSGLGEGNTESGFAVLEQMFPESHPLASAKNSRVSTTRKAEGGMVSESGEPVPIMAAGGEFVISPESIKKRWGDLETGHKFLDHFVIAERKKLIKTLKGLPGPAQD